MYKRLLCILCIFTASSSLNILASCSDAGINYPEWYINPAANSYSKLYGVGEGDNLDEAKKAALNDIASKLRTSISSTIESSMQADDKQSTSSFSQKISAKVNETTFNNYNVKFSTRSGDKFFVQIEVDRRDFLNEKNAKLKQITKRTSDMYSNAKSTSILEKRNTLQKIINIAVNEEEPLIYLIASLDDNFDKDQYLSTISTYEKELDSALSKMRVYIVSNNKKLTQVFKNALNDQDIRVVENKFESGPNLVILNIDSISTKQQVLDSFMEKMIVTASLKSETGIAISSKKFEFSGSSVISANEASNAAIESLRQKIKDEGIKLF